MRIHVGGREGKIYTQRHARRSNRLRASRFARRRRLFFQGPVMPIADLRNSRIDAFIASFAIRLRGRGTSVALTLWLLSSVLLSACGAPEPAQRDRFYSLAPQLQSPPAASAPLRATLLVNDLRLSHQRATPGGPALQPAPLGGATGPRHRGPARRRPANSGPVRVRGYTRTAHPSRLHPKR